METKILYKSKASLLEVPIEIKISEGITYAVIEAEEEHKIWEQKLFPGDDRDHSVQMHPREIIFEVNNQELVVALKEINKLTSPLILFTFEGVKPRILLDVQAIEKVALEQLDKNVVVFPNNPKADRLRKIEEEEERLMRIDPKDWWI